MKKHSFVLLIFLIISVSCNKIKEMEWEEVFNFSKATMKYLGIEEGSIVPLGSRLDLRSFSFENKLVEKMHWTLETGGNASYNTKLSGTFNFNGATDNNFIDIPKDFALGDMRLSLGVIDVFGNRYQDVSVNILTKDFIEPVFNFLGMQENIQNNQNITYRFHSNLHGLVDSIEIWQNEQKILGAKDNAGFSYILAAVETAEGEYLLKDKIDLQNFKGLSDASYVQSLPEVMNGNFIIKGVELDKHLEIDDYLNNIKETSNFIIPIE